MESTETTKKKKLRLNVVLSVLAWTLICIMFLWTIVDDGERAKTEN